MRGWSTRPTRSSPAPTRWSSSRTRWSSRSPTADDTGEAKRPGLPPRRPGRGLRGCRGGRRSGCDRRLQPGPALRARRPRHGRRRRRDQRQDHDPHRPGHGRPDDPDADAALSPEPHTVTRWPGPGSLVVGGTNGIGRAIAESGDRAWRSGRRRRCLAGARHPRLGGGRGGWPRRRRSWAAWITWSAPLACCAWAVSPPRAPRSWRRSSTST